MFSYSKFLFKNIFTKISFYLLLAAAIAAISAINMIQLKQVNDSHNSYLTSMSMFKEFFPFLFASAYTTLIIIFVFKAGEKDGSELLIASKPISRAEIVFGKFFVLLIMNLMYFIPHFSVHIFTGMQDEYFNLTILFKFAGSMALGALIIQIIISPILILISTRLSSVGTMIIGIITSSFIPIFSTILATTTKGILPSEDRKSVTPMQIFGKNQLDQIYEHAYSEDHGSTDVSWLTNKDQLARLEGVGTTDEISGWVQDEKVRDKIAYNQNIHGQFRETVNSVSYDKAVYFDVWYQFEKFFRLFMNSKEDRMAPQKWSLQNVKFTSNKHFINKKGYRYIPNENWFTLHLKDGDKRVISTYQTNWIRIAISRDSKINFAFFKELFSSQGDKASVVNILNKYYPHYPKANDATTQDNFYSKFLSFMASDSVQSKYFTMHEMIDELGTLDMYIDNFNIYYHLQNVLINRTSSTPSFVPFVLPTYIDEPKIKDAPQESAQRHIRLENKEYVMVVREPFISSQNVSLAWGIIGFLLISITMFLYFRKDFK